MSGNLPCEKDHNVCHPVWSSSHFGIFGIAKSVQGRSPSQLNKPSKWIRSKKNQGFSGFSLVFSPAGKRTFQTGKELLVNLSCFLVLHHAGQILFYKNFIWPYCRLLIHPKKKLYKIFFQCLKEIYLLSLT